MIHVVLVGAAGRMGRAIEQAALQAHELVITARVEHRENFSAEDGVWTEDAASVIEPGVVVIEFSSPEGAAKAARLCAERAVPLVTGTTGLSAEHETDVRTASARTAVLRASNFSVGIAALRRALAATLAAVPATWDVEVVERHHRQKKDSPSGTALALVTDVLAHRGLASSAVRNGREGAVGPRPVSEVGVHAMRGGTWVGDHMVVLAGEGETIELRHSAQDRAAFANGALAAARFVATAKPGLYGIEDLLERPGSKG
ncbi:MAG TPA: 4-hydroxy-tetrahydrodipicolinate reductase [Candidatus Acidoferrales bacterium]|nr:4-hydroxy-tetrahydrodipicolinate reductase [Candidatus Acidoferrales bacterium]